MTSEIATNQHRDPSVFTPEELIELNALKVDENGFVAIGQIANMWLGEQSQYVSRYFSGVIDGYPKLTDGLAYDGQEGNYHSLKLAQKDVKTFIIRLRDYRWRAFEPCR
jgi:hypothetical protein